ncbi:MAG: Ig-like domain repeat protein [Acidobacteriaceae bacterium]|nr:Ig-like domain repeat protein [Acidobacteriaceae bacterium]
MIYLPRTCRSSRWLAAVLALGLSAPLFAQSLSLPAGSTDLGVLPASTPVKAALFVKPTAARQAALDQLLADQGTPGSASYHQWLTPAQFTSQYGATSDQLATISAYAAKKGLKVESSTGLHVELSATRSKFSSSFGGGLHQVSLAGQLYTAETEEITTPTDLETLTESITGVQTVPEAHPFTLLADGTAVTASGRGSLEDLATAIEGNTARVLTIHSAASASQFTDGEQTALHYLLKEAAAQGITVLAEAGGTTADTGLPAAFSEGLAAIVTPTGELGTLADELRPTWQTASGVPDDGLRHIPDVTVSSIDALAATFEQILSEMPATSDGSAARLGNVAATIYELAPSAGLFTQPDDTSTTTPGRWEPDTGLGTLNLAELAKLYPRGTYSTDTSVTLDNPGATHGQSITFTSTVKDTSGQGNGVVPTGTVTYTMSTGTTLGPVTLSNGTATITTKTLAANWSYTVSAAYSGDTNYAASSSSTGFSIAPEAATITATPAGSVKLGDQMSVAISVSSASGVGTPTGTATLAPQGTSDTNTYTAPLSGSNGTATATVSAPSLKAGSTVVLAGCTPTSTDFTCYTPVQANVTVTQGTPTATLSSVVSGTSTTFTVTVAGLGASYPTPVGNISVADSGVTLGSATLSGTGTSASATLTVTTPSSTSHTYVATYDGDSNYLSTTSNAQITTGTTTSATTLAVSPNPPVSGSTTTLTATVASGATSSTTTPTGTVTFYQDGVALTPTGTLVNGVATYTSTTLSSTTAHTYYAAYSGDTTYATSNSPSVATAAVTTASTTTTMTVSPNPPVSGSVTTLTATIGYTASGSTTPTGSVTFYQDGTALVPTATVSNGVATYTSSGLSSTIAHTFYAKYSGDTNYTTSTSATVTTNSSTAATTTTTMAITPNPPVSGSVTTLKATIGYTASGTTTPSGTVTFYQDGAALTPTATVTSGVATFTSTALSGTTAHSFYAVYSGDTNFSTSTSTAVTTAASTSSTTTTAMTVSPNPPVSGKLTTLMATVAFTGTSTPTGTVTFYQDGAALTPAASLSVSGTTASAAFTSTVLSSTTAHTYYAVYSGDTNYTTSTSAAVATAASSGTVASTTTIASSASTVTTGGSVTLTATVVPTATNTVIPTGTVTFTSATQGVLGTGTLNAAGVATLTTALTTAGVQSITASYGGDTTYAASVSAVAASVTVSSSTSQFTLTVSPQSVTYGSTVTLTTTLTATPTSGTTGPAGTVTWTLTPNSGAAAITYVGTLTTTSTTTATATTSITAPAVGIYTVTATCTGTNFSCTGLSATAALQVTKVATVTSLNVSPTTIVTGGLETLTAYVAFASGTTNATCTGAVTFYVNGASAGSAALSSNSATYTLTLPSSTKNTVYAVYAGDTNCGSSTSTVATIAAATVDTTSTLTPNYTTALQGANEIFTVVVSSVATTTNTSPGIPTGTVNFYDTFGGIQTLLGSAALTQGGVSSAFTSFQTTGLKAGTHTILAVFAGSTSFTTSTATAVAVTIQDYSVVFSPSSATTTKGQTVTALATVAPQYGFTGSVVLACTPPAGTATTCSFSPSVLTGGGGVATMTITTTAATAALHSGRRDIAFAGVAGLGALLLGFIRRRRVRWLQLAALAMAIFVLGTTGGCTTVRSETSTGGGGSSSSGGTPSGAQQFTITAAGTDGVTTNKHTAYFQVTIQ